MTRFDNFAGNESYGTETNGKLFKKIQSLFQHWQKSDCEVKDGHLYISTGDDIRPPTKIEILTLDVKKCPDEEFVFDIKTPQKSYKFKALDEKDFQKWMNVILNAKRKVHEEIWGSTQSIISNDELDGNLIHQITNHIKNVPGNEKCCDCGSEEDVTWISVNLGILVCINCAGFHRGTGLRLTES